MINIFHHWKVPIKKSKLKTGFSRPGTPQARLELGMRPNLTVQFGYGQFNPAGKHHCLNLLELT